MSLPEMFLPEFDHETQLTRKFIERAPEGRFDWKPHPKSPTLGWLAAFLSVLPGWAVATLKQDSLDLKPGGVTPAPPPGPRTVQEILATFDKNVADARAAIAETSDEQFAQPWSLLENGRVLMRMPRSAVLRNAVISHLIHHRAQLGVYLRMCDVAVPATYGPSADENPWG